MSYNNITGEVLQDIKNGKRLPWKPKKARNVKIADSFKRLSEKESDFELKAKLYKKAVRVRFCACELDYLRVLDLETGELGEKTLYEVHFCRERLCPMCQWRRSLKVFHGVSGVMDAVQVRYPSLVPIFLTLTVKNCRADELNTLIDGIFQGWYQLLKHRKVDKVVEGWFRALEVTYDGEKVISRERYKEAKEYYDGLEIKIGDVNPNYDTFHPHIHAILLVDKSYFKGKDYMDTVEWVQKWRTAMKLDYDPVCDIRKVKTNRGRHKAVAEVSKYTLKDTDFLIDGDTSATDRLVEVLGNALKNRRLYAFGGIMKKIAKELKTETPDDGDLIHIDENAIREDVATVIEKYRWNFGVSNYVRVRE
jgi:plasmid rolling circle replication initiator protein Rep